MLPLAMLVYGYEAKLNAWYICHTQTSMDQCTLLKRFCLIRFIFTFSKGQLLYPRSSWYWKDRTTEDPAPLSWKSDPHLLPVPVDVDLSHHGVVLTPISLNLILVVMTNNRGTTFWLEMYETPIEQDVQSFVGGYFQHWSRRREDGWDGCFAIIWRLKSMSTCNHCSMVCVDSSNEQYLSDDKCWTKSIANHFYLFSSLSFANSLKRETQCTTYNQRY